MCPQARCPSLIRCWPQDRQAPRGRFVGLRWEADDQAIPLDGETLRRPMWINRGQERLSRAAGEADKWFAQFTERLTLQHLLPTGSGCVVHTVAKGQPVDFRQILRSTGEARITRAVLQDPYLLTDHQLKCFDEFLAGVRWPDAGAKVPFRLITHMSDSDPRERNQLTTARQQQEINRRLGERAGLEPNVEYKYWKYAPLHMRYAYFALDGRELLYIFERGLDMADPKAGTARADSYVLEFPRNTSRIRWYHAIIILWLTLNLYTEWSRNSFER